MTKAHEDRSIDWSHLIGFEEDLERVQNLYKAEKLPQVILFLGREGIGKTLFMAKLTALIYCEQQRGCGHCSSCLEVLHSTHRELLWLDPETKFKVEHGRQLQEHFSISASQELVQGELRSIPRIATLIDIERCTDQAANQLLKTLEEPQSGTFILMTSSKPRQILDTILSRAIRWQLRPPNPELGLQWLCGKWSSDYSQQEIAKCYGESGYSIGKAHRYLTHHSSDEQQQVDDVLRSLLFGKDPGQALEAATILTKQIQLSVNDITLRIELLLNQYYRWRLGALSGPDADFFTRIHPQIDAETRQRWRQNLARFRSLAGRSQIPLNAQMVTESFALTR